MLLLDLPGDVLHAILSTCSTPSLNALVLTSSECKDLATAHFLRSVRLDRDPAQVISFLNYILSNTRFYDDGSTSGDCKQLVGAGTYVRSLEILHQTNIWLPRVPNPISTWAPLLIRTLALMPNLRAIAVNCNGDVIVDSSVEFPSTLLHLRSLDLSGLTESTSRRFGKAMTKLKDGGIYLQRLKLFFNESSALFADEGIGSILFCSRESLKEIELSRCRLNDVLCGVQIRAYPASAVTIFPGVTNISLFSCSVSSHMLSCSFPNVHTLTLARLAFTADHACPASCPMFPHGLFRKLSTLQGACADITRFLEMHGPDNLRRVAIQDAWSNLKTDDLWETEPLDLPAFPHLRSLHFSLWIPASFSWWKGLTNSSPHLTFLSFAIHVTIGVDFELVCVKIPQLLAFLPLEYIDVGLSFRWWEQVFFRVSNADQTVALAYAQNIPTLKYFEISDQAPSGQTWWRVVRETLGTAGQNDVYESIGVRKIDDMDGENRREFFDWNW